MVAWITTSKLPRHFILPSSAINHNICCMTTAASIVHDVVVLTFLYTFDWENLNPAASTCTMCMHCVHLFSLVGEYAG